jgi:acetyl-CoA carboxylase carboxyltransferase component
MSERSMDELIEDLERRRAEGLAMGGPERVERHKATGRMTVRERIDGLLDEGSFFEIGLLAQPELREEGPVPADGSVTGWGEIGGRAVAVIGIDATTKAGTTAPVGMRKQGKIIAQAEERGIPLVVLADADGGRIPDVMGWRFSGLPFDFRTFIQTPPSLTPVPRICALFGPSYGDAGLHAAHSHYVIMTQSASVALSGPSVVAAGTGERVSDIDLGGPKRSMEVGNAHMVVEDEPAALQAIRDVLAYLPDHAGLAPPALAPTDPATNPAGLTDLVPTARRRGYDVRTVIDAIVDAESVFPYRADGHRSLVTCFARLEGRVVGVLANQPMHLGGVLTPGALAKELDFVDLCDTFGIPLIFLHDVPGLLVGSGAEAEGVLRKYEALAARIARATVPKLGVVMRKAYGGGHYAMGGQPTRPDLLVAWPTAEMGFMAPDVGIRTVHRRRLEEAEADGTIEEVLADLERTWEIESEPWEAAAHTYLDDVIDPRDTRDVLVKGLRFATGNRDRRERMW